MFFIIREIINESKLRLFLYKTGDVRHLTSFCVITLSAKAWRCCDDDSISVADTVFLSSMPVKGDIMKMAEVNE
jgi:hypothetical protein